MSPLTSSASLEPYGRGLHGASVLREFSKDPVEMIESIMARLGRVERVLRTARVVTTLDGIVPDEGTVLPGKTIVEFDIRAAARETGDHSWALGTGTGERGCVAEGAILAFFRDVQAEVKRLRAE